MSITTVVSETQNRFDSPISGSDISAINVTASIVSASQFIGDGSGLTGVSSPGTISSSLQFTNTDDVTFRNVTASVFIGDVGLTTVSTKSISDVNIDWSSGSVFTKVIVENTIFTFSNIQPKTIIVGITNSGSYTSSASWPSINWSSGSEPVLSTSSSVMTDVFTFVSFGNNISSVYGVAQQHFPSTIAGVPFDPISISGMKVWLRADMDIFSDAGITPAINDDPVYQWNDQSGNGNHVVQTTVGLQPLFKPSTLSGKPILRFDGVDDLMDRVYTSPMAQPATMFVVVNDKTSGAQNSIIDSTDPLLRHVFGKYVFATPDTFGLYAYNGLPPGFDGVVDSWPTGFRVWTLVFNGGASSITKNGTLVQAGTVGTDVSVGLRLGANNSGGGPTVWADMDIAEVLIYNSPLSNSQRTAVEAYLNTKYAIY